MSYTAASHSAIQLPWQETSNALCLAGCMSLGSITNLLSDVPRPTDLGAGQILLQSRGPGELFFGEDSGVPGLIRFFYGLLGLPSYDLTLTLARGVQ